ncbi:ferredoxin [Sinorhizobium meliloti]|nr:ferredoxin [Sinorhizobium meliloti]MQV76835.1 ferredoxin [Sinorhizobium meliloti]RVJ06817.1 ferredoxin [Sinorhizobium meliloti]
MTIVVTENCHKCRFTECVDVCPVGCFRLGDDMVYIAADDCIECRACIPVCPVSAIYDSDDLPPHLEKWVGINREFADLLPAATARLDPLPGAEERRQTLVSLS